MLLTFRRGFALFNAVFWLTQVANAQNNEAPLAAPSTEAAVAPGSGPEALGPMPDPAPVQQPPATQPTESPLQAADGTAPSVGSEPIANSVPVASTASAINPGPPAYASPPLTTPPAPESAQASLAPRPLETWQQREERRQRTDPRGTYFQLRAMGLFGVNSTHEFRRNCPTYDCAVSTPLGLGVGFTLGWEKKGWGLEVLGLFLFDHTRASYHHPVQKTIQVPDPNASASASGSGSGNGGADVDIKIGTDGIKIGGDILGGLDGKSNASGETKLISKTVTVDQKEDVNVARVGGALGVGVRRNFGRRPARVSMAFSGGVLHRGISLTGKRDVSAPSYTAPFLMADIGFIFGKRGGVQLSLVGMAEFPGSRWVHDVPGLARIRVSGGAQYFLGPLLGIQWGPRSPPSKREPQAGTPGQPVYASQPAIDDEE